MPGGHRIDRELLLHPFPAGLAHSLAQMVVVHQFGDGVLKCVDILGRREQSRFTVGDRFNQPTGCESYDRHACGRRFERGDTQALGQRGMHEQVETRHVVIEIVAKTGELHDVAEAQSRRL